MHTTQSATREFCVDLKCTQKGFRKTENEERVDQWMNLRMWENARDCVLECLVRRSGLSIFAIKHPRCLLIKFFQFGFSLVLKQLCHVNQDTIHLNMKQVKPNITSNISTRLLYKIFIKYFSRSLIKFRKQSVLLLTHFAFANFSSHLTTSSGETLLFDRSM